MEQYTAEPLVNFAEQKFRAIFSDVYFLVICILASVSAGWGLLVSGSFDVIGILLAVGAWLVYARYGIKNPVQKKSYGLKIISGTTLAEYILNWVAAGFLAVAALLVIVVGILMPSSLNVYDIADKVGHIGNSYALSILKALQQVPFSVFFFLLAIALLVAAAVVVVLNIFLYRPLRLMTKSFSDSEQTGNINFQCVHAVRVWLFVLGILKGVSALSSLGTTAFIAPAAGAAACILTSIWIKKHLDPQVPQTAQQPEQPQQ